jgi:O-succinylbenzoate synthase
MLDPCIVADGSGPILLTKADLFRVAIPMREPFRISSGEVARKDAIVLRLGDKEHHGWGESSAMGGGFYSSETPDGCEAELANGVLGAVLGREFSSMLALEKTLVQVTENRFVRVAVETAAWEFVACRRNVSLRQLFGIPDRPIPSGLAVGLYPDLAGLKDAIHRYDPHQYKRLKLKIKWNQDIEIVRAARSLVGDFPLFVDANADYSLSDLGTFAALDRESLMMFEQPFAKDNLAGSAELQQQVRTPVCLDESIETAEDARRAIGMGACRIVNIKLQRVGGYLEALRIVQVCAEHNVPVWMGTMPELGIGSAQALMLAAHPSFSFPTDVEPSTRWYLDDIVTPAIQLSNASICAPAGPGVGYRVDERKLEQYTIHRRNFTV